MHSVLHAFTHSVVWASVLASAFVAAVVTMVVEYFAKPGLEARKDRILDKGRQQRTALNGVRRSTILIHRLQTYRRVPGGVGLLKDRINRATADLEQYMIAAFETLNVPESISSEWEYTTSAIDAFATVFRTLPATDNVRLKLDAAFAQLRDFEMLFTTSKWHPRRRRELIRKIRSSPPPNSFKQQPAREDDSLSSGHQDGTTKLWP